MGRSNAAWIGGIRDDYELELNRELEEELYCHESCKVEVIDIEDLVNGTYEYDGTHYVSTAHKKGKREQKRRRDMARGYPETRVEREIRKWHERWEKYPPLKRKWHIALWYLDDFLSPEDRAHYCFMCNGSAEKLVELAYNDCMKEVEYEAMNDPDPVKALYLLEQRDFDHGDEDTAGPWGVRRKPITIHPEIPEHLKKRYNKWLKKHPVKDFADIPEARRKFLRKYLKEDRKEQDKLLFGSTKNRKRARAEGKRRRLAGEELFSAVPDEEEMLEAIRSASKKTEELTEAIGETIAYDLDLGNFNEKEVEKLNKTLDKVLVMRDRCCSQLDDYSMQVASHMARKVARPRSYVNNPSPPVTLILDDGRELVYDYDGNIVSERYNETADTRKHRKR